MEPLFQAYLALVCPFYPIVHSKKLRDMHNRRQKPNDLYEVCTLRLVYAIGGVTLELVRSWSFFLQSNFCLLLIHLFISLVPREGTDPSLTNTTRLPWHIGPQ